MNDKLGETAKNAKNSPSFSAGKCKERKNSQKNIEKLLQNALT